MHAQPPLRQHAPDTSPAADASVNDKKGALKKAAKSQKSKDKQLEPISAGKHLGRPATSTSSLEPRLRLPPIRKQARAAESKQIREDSGPKKGDDARQTDKDLDSPAPDHTPASKPKSERIKKKRQDATRLSVTSVTSNSSETSELDGTGSDMPLSPQEQRNMDAADGFVVMGSGSELASDDDEIKDQLDELPELQHALKERKHRRQMQFQ